MHYRELEKYLHKNKKKWLITGVAGFIGSHLLHKLLDLDQEVIGIDNLSTGNKENIKEIKTVVSKERWNNFIFIEGDILDSALCHEVTLNVDIILHQAALGSVPRSIKNPLDTNSSNNTGFITILDAARVNKVERFIYASSSSVYGDNESLPKVERHVGTPLSPYAVTKKINELFANVYYKTYGLKCIGLRYFNVFGPRQNSNGAYAAVIPSWIKTILSNNVVEINGDGKTSRDFSFIDNIVQANLLAAMTSNEKAFGEVFNAAAGGQYSLLELYESIKTALSKNVDNLLTLDPVFKPFRKGDIKHSNADINKIKSYLGYIPTHDLTAGLSETVTWYLDE